MNTAQLLAKIILRFTRHGHTPEEMRPHIAPIFEGVMHSCAPPDQWDSLTNFAVDSYSRNMKRDRGRLRE